MSADNGVYILETEGPEYRVAHLQNIEDVDAGTTGCPCGRDDDQRIINARQMWSRAEVVRDRTQANLTADKMADGIEVLEYGISTIRIPRQF